MHGTTVPLHDRTQQSLVRLEALAKLMDGAFVIPGTTIRLGLDGLIGLIPVAGDMIAGLVSTYLIWEAKQLGAPGWLIARMLANAFLDTALGSVPVIGDAFDVLFRAMLRDGTIPVMTVIDAARNGHEDADYALRELIVEMLDRREELPTSLAAYHQEALLRAPVSYPPGRNLADTWVRDISIAVLIDLAVDFWPHLPYTRNRASKHPSACSVVAAALVKYRINVGERRVEKIYHKHCQLNERRLSATMPG